MGNPKTLVPRAQNFQESFVKGYPFKSEGYSNYALGYIPELSTVGAMGGGTLGLRDVLESVLPYWEPTALSLGFFWVQGMVQLLWAVTSLPRTGSKRPSVQVVSR